MSCRVDGCDKEVLVKKRQLCRMHYWRWYRTGDVGEAGYRHGRGVPYVDRLVHKIEPFASVDECWQWVESSRGRQGYGFMAREDNGGTGSAHRIVYEEVVEEVPGDLTIDHLCRNRACVNPDHLEVVTRAENTRRAHPLKTHCKRGHALTEDNVYVAKQGRRSCRECTLARVRKAWREKANARKAQ